MQGVDYENFMMRFRPLCDNVSTIVEQQKHIIELLKGTEDEKLFQALVWIYKKDTHSAAIVGELCDKILDRSGGLLGRVRDAAYPEPSGT